VNVAHWLARSARSFPDNAAVSRGPAVVASYLELARRVSALAASLRLRFQLASGERVALVMSNSPEYLEVLYAAWWAGLVAVPVNAKLHPEEVGYILEDSGASVCFVTDELAAGIGPLVGRVPGLQRVIDVSSADYRDLVRGAEAAEPCAVAAADVAWLFYTSGTTGRPKGVMITHRNLVTMTLCYLADVDRVAPGDCLLHAAPMSHGSGLYNFPHVLLAANQVVPESRQFDPAEIFALCPRSPGMSLFAAPTMVRRLTAWARERDPDVLGLKTVIYGGGPMYVEDIKQALEVLGERFVQIYGQGECPMGITALSRAQIADRAHARWEQRLGSVGVPQSAVEVVVGDGQDRPLPLGEIGEVLVRGDTVMRGYWRNPDATAETLRGGWLHTGDLGALDGDGFLTLRDRSRDMVITGGANVYPREVEEILLRHPQVNEASVVGRPDPEWGEEVVAFVVLQSGSSVGREELDALCMQHIARFKRPRVYRFVDSLPKNNYGKVLKTELRRWLRDEAAGGSGK